MFAGEVSGDDEATAAENEGVTAFNLHAGAYVLVRFDVENKKPVHYVGKLKSLAADEWNVEFYRKCSVNKMNANDVIMFAVPNEPDESFVSVESIVKTLPLKAINKAKPTFHLSSFSGIDNLRRDKFTSCSTR